MKIPSDEKYCSTRNQEGNVAMIFCSKEHQEEFSKVHVCTVVTLTHKSTSSEK